MIRYTLALMFALPFFATDGAATPLSGTSWQLLSIQSMDDAKGTTRVSEPSHFSLEFGTDGRATLRLDCNRGTGEFRSAPSSDGMSGSLSFGPVAMTRAHCPPPNLDERVARDLPFVRSYLLRDGKLYLTLMADGGIYEWAPIRASETANTSADPDRTVKPVRFAKGKGAADLRGRVVGVQSIDYQLQAGAGQRLNASLKSAKRALYFNVLPPGSDGEAMARGELLDNRFNGLLPDDGVYTVRVFLNRAAARRKEASDFTLSVGLTGTPLKPTSAKVDAVLPGTRYHAKGSVPCKPAFSKARECEALVVRRGPNGDATVELRWEHNGKRRILFVNGAPVASDSAQAMTFKRDERAWSIAIGADEQYQVPEPLVFGG